MVELGWDLKDLEFKHSNAIAIECITNSGRRTRLKYSYIRGTLLTGMNSRIFAESINSQVYNVEEAKNWVRWTPSKAINITEFNQQDINIVPPYIELPRI
jgi:hypothetical protein